ncbi:SDR family oxidoreductase [Nocardia rhamnosiphila]
MTARVAVVTGAARGIGAAVVHRPAWAATAASPGSTRTDMLTETAHRYGPDTVELFADHRPAGRPLEPDEVTTAVTWLCGADSAAVSGTVIHADGGSAP